MSRTVVKRFYDGLCATPRGHMLALLLPGMPESYERAHRACFGFKQVGAHLFKYSRQRDEIECAGVSVTVDRSVHLVQAPWICFVDRAGQRVLYGAEASFEQAEGRGSWFELKPHKLKSSG